jgi:rhomboid protease GluP
MSNIHNFQDFENRNLPNQPLSQESQSKFDKLKLFLKTYSKTLTFWIIIANILIYFAQWAYYLFIGKSYEKNLAIDTELREKIVSLRWFCTLYNFGAKYTPSIVLDNNYHRLLLPIFLHGSFLHILFNMLSLIMLKSVNIEKEVGRYQFLLLYFGSGIFASLVSAILDKEHIGVGASGSISGLIGYTLIFYSMHFESFNDAGKINLIIICVLQVILLFQSKSVGNSNVDIYAHGGGLICGMLISYILCHAPTNCSYRIYFSYKRVATLIFATVVVLLTIFLFSISEVENIWNEICPELFTKEY